MKRAILLHTKGPGGDQMANRPPQNVPGVHLRSYPVPPEDSAHRGHCTRLRPAQPAGQRKYPRRAGSALRYGSGCLRDHTGSGPNDAPERIRAGYPWRARAGRSLFFTGAAPPDAQHQLDSIWRVLAAPARLGPAWGGRVEDRTFRASWRAVTSRSSIGRGFEDYPSSAPDSRPWRARRRCGLRKSPRGRDILRDRHGLGGLDAGARVFFV